MCPALMEPSGIPRWQRLCALLLRFTGLLGGLLILSLAGVKAWLHDRLDADLILIGIAYPVIMWALARLLLRSPGDADAENS